MMNVIEGLLSSEKVWAGIIIAALGVMSGNDKAEQASDFSQTQLIQMAKAWQEICNGK